MKLMKKSTAVLICIVSLFWLVLCWKKYLWADEAYTLAMIKHNITEICNYTAADVHPPLYYIMLKCFSKIFGHTILVARMCSFIPNVLILVFGAWWLTKRSTVKSANIFVILMFCSPFFMQYVSEIRMYTWGAFFVFVSGIAAYEIVKSKENLYINLMLLIIFGVLAAYTHYFALVSVGIIYIILFFVIISRRRYLFMGYILAVETSIILYMPWITKFISQIKFKIDNPYWIAPITLDTIKGYFIQIFQPMDGNMYSVYFLWIVTIFLIVILIYLIYLNEFKNADITILGILIPLLTVGVGIIISLMIRPIFIIRYTIPSFPFFIISCAIIFGNIKSRKILSFMLAINIIIGAWAYSIDIQKSYFKKDYIDSLITAKYDNTISFGNMDIVSVLNYYDASIPMYVNPMYVSNSSPFFNIHAYSDDSLKNLKGKTLVLTDNELSSELVRQYNLRKIGNFSLFHGGSSIAYVMHR